MNASPGPWEIGPVPPGTGGAFHLPPPTPRQPYTVPAGAPPMPSAPPVYSPSEPAPRDAVPEGVIRTRAELESLRDDALEMLEAGHNDDFRIMWVAGPHDLREALRGILNAARWLLGETTSMPIMDERPERERRERRGGNDPDENGLPTKGQIFYERRDAEEAEEGFIRLQRYYAGGVRKTLSWATYEHEDDPRPIGPPLT
ncbi:hypothetical protein [Kitasatospora sp. KL5]|uniref:hypothetical protein n=1 Tax=Kitasatospora sp. KL5 TaxID=3425125 RepID=UPI003D6E6E5E